MNSIVAIYQNVLGSNPEISLEIIRNRLKYEMFPRYKLMLKTLEEVKNEIEYSISFTIGNKQSFDENDFLEFHKNIYWVQPKENMSNYLRVN